MAAKPPSMSCTLNPALFKMDEVIDSRSVTTHTEGNVGVSSEDRSCDSVQQVENKIKFEKKF